MIYLHIIMGLLLTATTVSCLYQYRKASPSIGHAVIGIHVLIYTGLMTTYMELFIALSRS